MLPPSKEQLEIQDLHNIQSELANYCKDLRKQINYWDENCSFSVVKDNYTFFYERWDKCTYEWHDLVGSLKKSKEKPAEEKAQMSLFDTGIEENHIFKIKDAWDYYAVELNNTWQLPIKTRLLLHLKVLRLCKQGMSLEDACKNVLTIQGKEDVMK